MRVPNEVCFNILSYLEADELRCKSTVCTSWRNFIIPTLWEKVVFQNEAQLNNFFDTLQYSKDVSYYFRHLRKLNCSRVRKFLTDKHLMLITLATGISRLNLSGCTRISEPLIGKLLYQNLNLVTINFSNIFSLPANILEYISDNCPNLKALNIGNCELVEDTGMVQIIKRCPYLNRLIIPNCRKLTDVSLQILSEKEDLIELDISGCEGFHNADTLSRLVSRNRGLKELSMDGCTELSHFITFLNLNCELDAMRALSLNNLPDLKDSDIELITCKFSKLNSLFLSKCIGLTDSSLLSLTKLSQSLTTLHLGHCYEITDIGVQCLLKSCKNITYIDFGGCLRLSDIAVSAIAKLPYLQRVGLVKCICLTDLSVILLSGSFSRNLERVHLSYCIGLTAKSVSYLMYNCKTLKHLSVTGINSILCTELRSFSRPIPDGINPSQVPVL